MEFIQLEDQKIGGQILSQIYEWITNVDTARQKIQTQKKESKFW